MRPDTFTLPDQNGKLAVITGASSGIGFAAARALAAKGAHVILAVRSAEKGAAAMDAIRQQHPAATLDVMALDLASLDNVRRFAQDFLSRFSSLPLLINNAGVMAVPRRKTADGFELQFGTNHLGHFALTGLLLPAILAAPGARVVTVSSFNHTFGRIEFDNLNAERHYGRWEAYNQSKLANLLFAYELQRRFTAAGVDAISAACHPGYASTNLQLAGPRMDGSRAGELMWRFAHLFGQSTDAGALPTLYAATAPGVSGGDYIGPTGLGGLYGPPGKVQSNSRSHDTSVARRLWEVSEQLTHTHYEWTH
jgi:NAD(P)-dependent dehydrogenase (short-subunit alcohol dehydrogenase family)